MKGIYQSKLLFSTTDAFYFYLIIIYFNSFIINLSILFYVVEEIKYLKLNIRTSCQFHYNL